MIDAVIGYAGLLALRPEAFVSHAPLTPAFPACGMHCGRR